MKNEEKERLIWDHFDAPLNSQTGADKGLNDEEWIKHTSHFVEIEMLNNDLKNMPLHSIDKGFSLQMQKSINKALAPTKKSNHIPFGLFLLMTGLFIFSLYFLFNIQLQNELKVSEWVSTWRFNMPSPDKISIPVDISYEINWSLYLILVVPIVLLSLDWLSENYSKVQSGLMKRSFLFA